MSVTGTFHVHRRVPLMVSGDGDAGDVRAAAARWEARLMDYLVDTVREAPEHWLLFRDDHLGGGA
ncbi:MAG: hypothetical protein R3E97_12295 [Candidatus Eisenbacteria bacterium]